MFLRVSLSTLFLFQKGKLNHIPVVKQSQVEPGNFLILVVVSMVFIVMVLGMSGALYCLRHRSHHKLKEKLAGLGSYTGHDATAAYQVGAGRLFQPIMLLWCSSVHINMNKHLCFSRYTEQVVLNQGYLYFSFLSNTLYISPGVLKILNGSKIIVAH